MREPFFSLYTSNERFKWWPNRACALLMRILYSSSYVPYYLLFMSFVYSPIAIERYRTAIILAIYASTYTSLIQSAVHIPYRCICFSLKFTSLLLFVMGNLTKSKPQSFKRNRNQELNEAFNQ